MTHEEIDVMWSIATRKSIEENQPYTRYEFAKLVAAKAREACAEICDDWANGWSGEPEMAEMADEIRARGNA
jgi:hypothetical protein